MPPMRAPTTGTPAMKASWTTSGEFSSQSDGTTSTSICAYTVGTAVAIERAHEAHRQARRRRAQCRAVVRATRLGSPKIFTSQPPGGQRADGVDQHVHALVPDERADVADAQRRAGASPARGRRSGTKP